MHCLCPRSNVVLGLCSASRLRRSTEYIMFRISPQHLCWTLENLVEGKVVNQIKSARGRSAAGEGDIGENARGFAVRRRRSGGSGPAYAGQATAQLRRWDQPSITIGPSRNLSIGRTQTLRLAEPKGYDWPMVETTFYPRHAAPRLTEALADAPVVLIHGARQCGKTTLAQMVGERTGYAYVNFDDDVVSGAAEADPAGFVADLPERTILDEVQRVPMLFTALKTAVDRKRVGGRFKLTGSAYVLLVPKLADSLARCELARRVPGLLDARFAGAFKTRQSERLGGRLAERIVAGGYPAALARPAGRRRAPWYREYHDALVQRDVRELARISSLDALPRLLALAAAQTARLLNVTDLAAPFQLSRPTIRDYVTLLERVFLLEALPPWHSNRVSRRIKTPKLHLGDTGLACALLGR